MRSCRPVVLCLLLLAGPSMAADLEYHFLPGETFSYRAHGESEKPTGGTARTTLHHRFTVLSVDPIRLRDQITGTSTEFDMEPVSLEFDLTPGGQVSNLSSPHLEDPILGALVKNTPWLFPRRPPGDVAVGHSWQAEGVVHSPRTSLVPNDMTRTRIVDTYSYHGAETLEDGTPVHRIGVTTRERSGEPVKMRTSGFYLFEPVRGRDAAAASAGKIKVKIGFIKVTIPTRSSVAEVDAASS